MCIRRWPVFRPSAAELTDIEQEIAGLMTYDRKPKVDPQLIEELNDLLR